MRKSQRKKLSWSLLSPIIKLWNQKLKIKILKNKILKVKRRDLLRNSTKRNKQELAQISKYKTLPQSWSTLNLKRFNYKSRFKPRIKKSKRKMMNFTHMNRIRNMHFRRKTKLLRRRIRIWNYLKNSIRKLNWKMSS